MPEATEAERSEYLAFLQSLAGRNTNNYPPIALPIHVFVISDDNGNLMNSGFDYVKNVKHQIEVANQAFNNGMSFYLCDLTYISNTEHHELKEFNDANRLYEFLHDPNYLPNDGILFPHDAITVVINAEGERPYAYQPENPYQIIRFGHSLGESFAHELGHCFGLYHTYELSYRDFDTPAVSYTGTSVLPDCTCHPLAPAGICVADCMEEMDVCNGAAGTLPCNCCNSGDLIADTPVDPGPVPCSSALTGGTPCMVTSTLMVAGTPPTTTTQTDYYYPQYNNIMSYYNDSDPTSGGVFTPMQKQRALDMLWNHQNRAYLIDNNLPPCNDYFVFADRGNVGRVFMDAQGQWQTEPVAYLQMTIQDHVLGQIGNSTSSISGNYTLTPSNSPAFPFSTEVDATVTQSQAYNEANHPVFLAKNGVTVLDATRVTKHILAVELLELPYYWIAADVNNSGSITTQDVIKIRKIILGLDQSFSPVPSWRFMPRYYLDAQWGFEPDFFQNPFTAELYYAGNSLRKYLPSGNEPSYLDRLDVVEYTQDIEETETWSFLMIKPAM